MILYIDDLLIHLRTNEEHLSTLDEVLQRLADNNMKINLAMCHFGNTEVSYLGFRLTLALRQTQGRLFRILFLAAHG